MTITASEAVQDALDLLAVLDEAETPSAAAMQTGIRQINAMLRRWEANGLMLGWSPVTNPSDDLPIPDEAEQAVTYGLAVRLAPRYGVEPRGDVVRGAETFLNDLRRDVAVASPIEPILDVPLPDAYYGAQTLGFGPGWT